MPLRLCVKAEILIAQLAGCSVGPVFRRQMPMIRVLLKKISLPKATVPVRSFKLDVQSHYPILQILACTFSFKTDIFCKISMSFQLCSCNKPLI